MFEGTFYSLGIPVGTKVADKLVSLILAIAKKEPSLGIAKELIDKIDVKGEFHVTLGVFHPGIFQTHRALFKHIIFFLRRNKQMYADLKKAFSGKIKIVGVGFDKGDIGASDVVWAAAESNEAQTIREQIHELLKLSGIDDSHFQFTDPHITLFMKKGKGDIHGIPKQPKIQLKELIGESHIGFDFNSVAFYKGPKELVTFGPAVDTKPPTKFKAALSELLKRESKGKAEYNWGNLFKDPEFGLKAKEIKETLIKEGPSGLSKKFGKDMGRIMGLLRKK